MANEQTNNDNRAIVVGAGLGGLAAAMRLGAKGYRVTVIDNLDRVGGRASSIEQDGHRFDLGPTIVTVPQVFAKLWDDCDRDFFEDVNIKSLEPFYEIRWPDGTSFKACSDDAKMEAEVSKLSLSDLAGYRKFLKDSYARYVVGFEGMVAKPMHKVWDTVKVLPVFAWLRADRSIFGLASARVKNSKLRMALSFHPLFIGGDPTHVTSMYALVAHLEKEYGVHYAMGGVQAIADAMAKVIRDQGGLIQLKTVVDKILIADGAARGVLLEDGKIIDAPLVVSNADSGHTYTTLMRDLPKRRWSEQKLSKSSWSMGLYVWYFGTKGTADKWADVGHHTILNGESYETLLHDIFSKGRLSDDMSLYIHRPAVTDPNVAPKGDDTFYVLSPVPHLGWDNSVDWETEEPIYRDKVAKVLETVIPGFEDHISTELTFTPNTFRDRYLSPHGCGFSIEPCILQSAWFRPHNVSEEAKGLYLVGAGTHPGAGLPGVVSSAEVLGKLVPDAVVQNEELGMAAE